MGHLNSTTKTIWIISWAGIYFFWVAEMNYCFHLFIDSESTKKNSFNAYIPVTMFCRHSSVKVSFNLGTLDTLFSSEARVFGHLISSLDCSRWMVTLACSLSTLCFRLWTQSSIYFCRSSQFKVVGKFTRIITGNRARVRQISDFVIIVSNLLQPFTTSLRVFIFD